MIEPHFKKATTGQMLHLMQAFCFTTVQANGVNEFTDNWVFSGFLEFFIKLLEFFHFLLELFHKLSDFSLDFLIIYFETMLKFGILLEMSNFLTFIYQKTWNFGIAWVFWRNPWVFVQKFAWVFPTFPWLFFFAEWKKSLRYPVLKWVANF